MKAIPDKNEIFHVHSFRCGHAEAVPDEAYIRKAIELGARGIWFSDHAPFPGNPFRNRMRYEELEEYLGTLTNLRERFTGQIAVHIGLEAEYLPSYAKQGYYERLRSDPRLEFLLLGQHFAETEADPPEYTFSWDKERMARDEYTALGEAVVAGIRSGWFDVVAHPDRIFRRRKRWDDGMEQTAGQIIDAAAAAGIPLELNMHSVTQKHHYWKEFWKLCPSEPTVCGVDAHSLEEMDRRYRKVSAFAFSSAEEGNHKVHNTD